MARQQIQFEQIDVQSLSEKQFEAFKMYLEAKDLFKQALQEDAMPGEKVMFTERYGTPQNPYASVLKVSAYKAKQAQAPQRQSLREYLDAKRNGGYQS